MSALPADHWLVTTPFVVVDVETTGLDVEEDRIVQLAMLHVDGGEITHEWSATVDPERPIPPEATAVHGIDEARVRADNALPFRSLTKAVLEAARGRQLVGYNAVEFDAPIIRAELGRCGFKTKGRTPLDPLVWVREIDRFVFGEGRHRHSLEESARRHGLTWEGSVHDALVDARLTWALMRRLVEARPHSFQGTIESVLTHQGYLVESRNKKLGKIRVHPEPEGPR